MSFSVKFFESALSNFAYFSLNKGVFYNQIRDNNYREQKRVRKDLQNADNINRFL